MSLDPLIAAWLEESKNAPPPASLADLRAATETGLRQLHGPLEDVASIKDYVLPGEHALAVRAYVPAGADMNSPCPPSSLRMAEDGVCARWTCTTIRAARWPTPPAA